MKHKHMNTPAPEPLASAAEEDTRQPETWEQALELVAERLPTLTARKRHQKARVTWPLLFEAAGRPNCLSK